MKARLHLDQQLVDSFLDLAKRTGSPDLRIAAQLVDLAWRRARVDQDLRFQWQQLTHRQQEVALLIYAGCSYTAIGRTLHLGVETIRTHARAIYAKLGITHKKELCAIMLRADLLDDYLEDIPPSAGSDPPDSPA